MAVSRKPPLGEIIPRKLYTKRAFMERLGITESTLREARRDGLQVHRVHKRAYIYGQDWIDYVRKAGAPSIASRSSEDDGP